MNGKHQLQPQRWFEDFALDEEFLSPSRTMTEALFAAFQLASADNHPSHYDIEYCRARGMPALQAHGFQTLIQTAAGAGVFPHLVEESMLGFIEQGSEFVAPVYAGDTLYARLRVAELIAQRSTGVIRLDSMVRNQRNETVLRGFQKYLLKKRPA